MRGCRLAAVVTGPVTDRSSCARVVWTAVKVTEDWRAAWPAPSCASRQGRAGSGPRRRRRPVPVTGDRVPDCPNASRGEVSARRRTRARASLAQERRRPATVVIHEARQVRPPIGGQGDARGVRDAGALAGAGALASVAGVGLRRLARTEREDLAAFLATLTPPQWQAPSLCSQWRVRDVAAHVISYDDLPVRTLLALAARSRLRPGRINAAALARYETAAPHDLLASRPQPRGLPAALGGRVGLAEALIPPPGDPPGTPAAAAHAGRTPGRFPDGETCAHACSRSPVWLGFLLLLPLPCPGGSPAWRPAAAGR